MYCKNCGNDNDFKFSANCGVKIENKNDNHNKKYIQYNRFLSNKSMFFMFLTNYILFVISTLDFSDSVLNIIFDFILGGLVLLLFDVFHLIPIILSILNIKKYKKGYVISCLVFFILMIIPMLFINLFLAIENLGIFRSNIMFWIFTIQSLLLMLTCLLKLIFKIKD